MRKCVLLFCLVILISEICLLANDAPVVLKSGKLYFSPENRIKLTDENINIQTYSYENLKKFDLRFKADYDCILNFENITNDTIVLNLIFPYENFYHEEIVDYKIRVNNQNINFVTKKNIEIEKQKFTLAYVSKVFFSPNSKTTIQHKYSLQSPDFSAHELNLSYFFLTGNKWKKNNTKCKVTIKLTNEILPYLYSIKPNNYIFHENKLVWNFEQLPDENLLIKFVDDNDYFYEYYSVLIDSEEIKDLYIDGEKNNFKSIAEIDKILEKKSISIDLKKFILYYLSEENLKKNSFISIKYLMQLADLINNKDYFNLHRLIKELIKLKKYELAKKYIKILSEQNEKIGYSIYGKQLLKKYNFGDK